MKALDNSIVRDRYDVVVVGAGIGGLTAAAMLAKKQLSVLLVEQHYMPGGCCASIRREGVTFDVGATVLYGFGETGLNTHRYVMNELEEEIDIIPRDAIFHLHVEDKELTFSHDFEPFFEEITALFPDQKEDLRKFYDYLFDFSRNILAKTAMLVPPTEAPLGRPSTPRSPEEIRRITEELVPMMSQDSLTFLKRFFGDPGLMSFMDLLTRTISYVDADVCPAILTASMLVDHHVGGAYYPAGSPQMLSNKLERAIERLGGQVVYRHLVDEILIDEGKACGVRLDDGTEILADRVVANGTIWNLYGKLVRPAHIAPDRMEWAQHFVPSHRNFMLYASVDEEAFPDWCRPMEIFIGDMHAVSGHGVTLYNPTLQDPSVSPPGVRSVTIAIVSDREWPRPWEPAYQSEAYQRLKREQADKVLDRVEAYIPNFRKHIRSMEIATPTTTERFTLKNWGNVGGPMQAIGQEMMNRPTARTDWQNLYLCGDSTTMGLGVLPVTMSAIGAANMVLRDLGQEEFLPHEFSRQYVNLTQGKPWTPPPDASEPITESSAMRLARECQWCEHAACIADCPAGIDLVGFMRRVESGNFAGAARSLRETNPLAEVCGHICPSERYCEKDCQRRSYADGPVRIRELHGWACGEVSGSQGWDSTAPAQSGHRVAVVGAGPAGLSCAYYLARLGHDVSIIEKSDKPGGMLSHVIPSFRLPADVLERELAGLAIPGIRFRFGEALGTDVTIAELEEEYEAVFLAPGLWAGRRLQIGGQEKTRITDALELLARYRETGEAEVGNDVLVIGGGSVACDAASTARRAGADRVRVVCLEREGEMPALQGEIEAMKKERIQVENAWGPKEITSPSRISFARCISVFDAAGEFSPGFDESETAAWDFDQLIVAIGQTAEPPLARYLEAELGYDGALPVDDETLRVKSRKTVFAGGDIVRGAGTAIQAAADGRRAAAAIHNYLVRNPG
jgi:NADPH-dependent glutamate synthase beta subunit-like oxidoreductase